MLGREVGEAYDDSMKRVQFGAERLMEWYAD
jgi:hypothetical protein